MLCLISEYDEGLFTSNIAIFNQENVQIEFVENQEKQTLWATQEQIEIVFGRDRSVISKHIKDILEIKELDDSVCAK